MLQVCFFLFFCYCNLIQHHNIFSILVIFEVICFSESGRIKITGWKRSRRWVHHSSGPRLRKRWEWTPWTGWEWSPWRWGARSCSDRRGSHFYRAINRRQHRPKRRKKFRTKPRKNCRPRKLRTAYRKRRTASRKRRTESRKRRTEWSQPRTER